MTILAHIALIGWIPVVLLLFAILPPRRAVLVSFLIGWLFLPMAYYQVTGFPNYTKMSATTAGALMGIALFDLNRLLTFRPRWFDIPMAVWCITPFFSSMTNELGMYDGMSQTFEQTIMWGFPYLIGRLYFSDPEGLRELAVGLFIGGMVYVPLCLWEVRMSPQLHRQIYGFHDAGQFHRGGGWRPIVFMQHGLMLAMWMTAASLVGVWLWKSKSLREVWGVPMLFLVPVLLVTTVLVKSAGALMLLAVGIAVLFAHSSTRLTIWVLGLALIPPVYITARMVGDINERVVDTAGMFFSEDRVESLEFRLRHEEPLMELAQERLAFGWGGWGRGRVVDEETGRVMTITDSLWIIALNRNGLVGVVSLFTAMLLPFFLLWWHHPAGHWLHPAVAPAAALAVVLVLYMIDNLFNAMVNPIFALAAGGVIGVDATVREMRRRQASRRGGAAPAAAASPPVKPAGGASEPYATPLPPEALPR
jgi:hypothetical protein